MLHWPAGCQDSGSNVLPQGDETTICSTPGFPALKVGLIQRQYWRALSGTPCEEGFVKDSKGISPEITLSPFLEVFSCSVFSREYMSRIQVLRVFIFLCWPWFYNIPADQPGSCPPQRQGRGSIWRGAETRGRLVLSSHFTIPSFYFYFHTMKEAAFPLEGWIPEVGRRHSMS